MFDNPDSEYYVCIDKSGCGELRKKGGITLAGGGHVDLDSIVGTYSAEGINLATKQAETQNITLAQALQNMLAALHTQTPPITT